MKWKEGSKGHISIKDCVQMKKAELDKYVQQYNRIKIKNMTNKKLRIKRNNKSLVKNT